MHPDYSTRPISWLHDLSELNERDITLLEEDIMRCRPEVVVIDVDKVSPNTRIHLRHRLASKTGSCWVRVYSTEQGIREIVNSINSIRAKGDNWWKPEISRGTEVIFGCSPRPMSLYKSIDCDLTHDRTIRFPSLRPSWDELVEFVLHFNGSVSDATQVENFLFTRPSGKHETIFQMYTRCIEDPGGALQTYGRFSCRMLMCVIRWIL